MSPIKEQLYQVCLAQINERITLCQQAIKEVQNSANEETKSSAGDKYETGRAMAQLEIEKNAAQLQEAARLKLTLEQFFAKGKTATVQMGSLVSTNEGNFYLAVPLGGLKINDTIYYTLSGDSPVGKLLLGLKEGDAFNFRGKTFIVTQID
jgi:transcription elongation GreA/GreB family factor